jgi:acyl phosphate:glycerol-3-phosphate acyltransferase
MTTLHIAIACLVFFLVGGIPFGTIIARTKKVDLSKIGSGNIGTTNVYRALGMKYAVLVFFLDALKGTACTILGRALFGAGMLAGISGLVAVAGHIFSPYLKFKGGKGVATGFGVMLALVPIPSLISFGIWLLIVGLSRIVSMGSLIAAIVLPILVYLFDKTGWAFYSTLILVAMVILSHYENIIRIIRKEEKPVQRIED